MKKMFTNIWLLLRSDFFCLYSTTCANTLVLRYVKFIKHTSSPKKKLLFAIACHNIFQLTSIPSGCLCRT